MKPELHRALERMNHIRGHALDRNPRPITPKKMKCHACSGNAISRALCTFCHVGLCRRHTVTVEGATYCRKHAPGYCE